MKGFLLCVRMSQIMQPREGGQRKYDVCVCLLPTPVHIIILMDMVRARAEHHNRECKPPTPPSWLAGNFGQGLDQLPIYDWSQTRSSTSEMDG